jgi:glycosyltransferase involved in cell wall biosynthesis
MTAAPAGGKRIRVLQIVTWLGVGGAERLVFTAATGLPRATFETAVCCFSERGPFADAAERAGVPVWCLGTFPSVSHPAALARLFRIIRSYAPDIVHTHLQAPNLYGRLAALAARVPVVIASEHNVYTSKARRYVLVERWLARHTSALVAVSDRVRRFLASQLGIEPSAIEVVENGIAHEIPDPDRVAALRTRLALPPSRHVIVTVASLTAKKGHTHLLEAQQQLRSRGVDCTIVLAGDGPERASLEARALSLGVADRVVFLGVQPHVADVLAVGDIFVLPSLVEGLPLAMLEAMAAGKAVVATAVGGVPDVIVDRVNGLLVEPRSATAIVDAVQLLVADAALRERLGPCARTTVAERFTDGRHLAALAALYRRLAMSSESQSAEVA